ncbi:Nn.00g090420.m01.CDS01 [Neocucurbitaria sp. VM-36]
MGYISKGCQQEVVRASDGAHSTTKTMLYNHLRAGVAFEELKKLHDEAAKAGDGGWGPEGRLATYAGAAVGLVHSVEDAGALVERLRGEASTIIKELNDIA